MTTEATTTAHDTTTRIDTETARAAAVPRSIFRVVKSPGTHWVGDGFRVAGYFSAVPEATRRLSPFLLLDYHPEYTYGPTTRRRGVGSHPHRGFETVTLAFSGRVAHHDSTGSGGVIGPGDVQWMTAASGILHQEYHDEQFARHGGVFHMAQLWVNLPADNKMDPPGYQGITADTIPDVALPDDAGTVRLIAGDFRGARGPAHTHTPIRIFDATMREDGAYTFEFPATENVAILVMSGSLVVNGDTAVSSDDFVVFENSGQSIQIRATEAARFLVLNGEPIREPVVQYGPFVMNTKREIIQAIEDFESGRFGTL